MKNVKFRAWATITKVMIDPETIHNNFKGYADNKNYLMLQFTGLYDKYGVEIFEGDILEWQGDISVVEWLDGDVCFDTSPTLNGLDSIRSKQYEVIGNIYETPSLMKGKNDK